MVLFIAKIYKADLLILHNLLNTDAKADRCLQKSETRPDGHAIVEVPDTDGGYFRRELEQ